MAKFDKRLAEIQQEIYESLERTVKISNGEAERITTADLLEKYSFAKKTNRKVNADLLEKVIRMYYLTDDEWDMYTSARD